ncbi:hypothetical protein [Ottowia sp.]|uniref:hypothetical protein n=1 Tax=Ottowia sp. TaxID=1898956 RepID=UPI0025FCBE61|nr:hypothetical protein [Ottowia sp.]MBK6616699.1 hypothetical protein [Ottowia sp.]
MKRLILSVALCITCMQAWAGVWSSTYKIVAGMGEHDTRSSLRASALGQARTRAANEVGMVVLHRQELNDEQLFEQTRLVSAALVKLKVAKETVREGHNGSATVEFDIVAEVDDSELERQLAAMREDVAKSDLIKRLARDNSELRARLIELRAGLASTGDAAVAQELLRQVNIVLSRQRAIDGQVVVALQPGGIARMASSGNEARLATLIDEALLLPLLRSEVRAELGNPRRQGRLVEVPITLRWSFDIADMKRSATAFSTPLDISGRSAEEGFCAHTSSRDDAGIGKQLRSDAVAIEVKIGETKGYFLIAGIDELGRFCVVNGPFVSPKTVILSLSESDAIQASSVVVRTVRASEIGGGWRKVVRNDLLVRGM